MPWLAQRPPYRPRFAARADVGARANDGCESERRGPRWGRVAKFAGWGLGATAVGWMVAGPIGAGVGAVVGLNLTTTMIVDEFIGHEHEYTAKPLTQSRVMSHQLQSAGRV